MLQCTRILEALNQGAPKPAILRAIREAGIKCASLGYSDSNNSFEDVYFTDKAGIDPPNTYEVYNLPQQLERGDIDFLLRGGVITYTSNPNTGVSWEWSRSITN